MTDGQIKVFVLNLLFCYSNMHPSLLSVLKHTYNYTQHTQTHTYTYTHIYTHTYTCISYNTGKSALSDIYT